MLDFQELLAHDAHRKTGGRPVGDCGTILIVDHEDASRSEAVRVAVRLGFEPRPAENAELLLERLDDERPALAIVEVELPGPTSGFELLRELHDRFGEELPVILVSGERTTPLDCVAGLQLGADDYVIKPFDSGELLARVRRSLSRRQRRGTGNGNGAPPNGEPSLSPREREILTLLAEGKTQKQIAAALVISSKTVATHIQHLLAKLGVTAYRQGLVGSDVLAHALVPLVLTPE
ncbi:MAG: response regulator transcription factor [Actinobacteria bacterium]|nr:MAG: response regulator transcription factor [Actinomycetota bacterium]